MKYLDRKGDIEEIAKIPSINILNNLADIAPKFCFIVPTYKRADLLQYALDSILGQETDEKFEILVVDDNPERKDETELLMISRYNMPGITYYKNSKNHRQEGNWNKLFFLSRTEWIIMLHDDDMLYPNYMKYLLKTMNFYSKNIGGFFPSFVGYEFSNDILPDRKKLDIHARVIKKFDFLRGCILGAPLGMCVRRDLVLELGGVNKYSGVAVDYDFFNRLCKVTDVVKMYDYPLGVWRVMDNVSQRKETVQFCVEWGDVLKMETLEDCGLKWFTPIYISYVRAFDRQHIENWFKSMGKGKPEEGDLKQCSKVDKFFYKVFVAFFAFCRRIRLRNRTIKIEG